MNLQAGQGQANVDSKYYYEDEKTEKADGTENMIILVLCGAFIMTIPMTIMFFLWQRAKQQTAQAMMPANQFAMPNQWMMSNDQMTQMMSDPTMFGWAGAGDLCRIHWEPVLDHFMCYLYLSVLSAVECFVSLSALFRAF